MKNPIRQWCLRISMLFLFQVVILLNHAGAQCTSYFQSSYNGATDQIDFTPVCTYDTSVHPIIFQWDFGDGTGAYGENPSHHYANPNNYYVCLILWVGNGAGCCQDTFCEMIDFVPSSIPKTPEWISNVSVSSLQQNVTLKLTLEKPSSIVLQLVTISGMVIPLRLSNAELNGKHEIVFSMPDYPPGIYTLRISDAKGNYVAKRFMLY